MTSLTTKPTRTFSAYLNALALPVLLLLVEYAAVILAKKSGLISIEWSSIRFSIVPCVIVLVSTAISFSDDEKGNFFFAPAGLLITWAIALIVFLIAFLTFFDLSFVTGRNVLFFIYFSFLFQGIAAYIKNRY